MLNFSPNVKLKLYLNQRRTPSPHNDDIVHLTWLLNHAVRVHM